MTDTLKYQIYELQQYWKEPGKQDSEDVEFYIYLEDDTHFRWTLVIHGETKHVVLFPMWIWAYLLTFNC